MFNSSETPPAAHVESILYRRWLLVVVLVVAASLSLIASFFAYEIYVPYSPTHGIQEVVVAQGMGSRAIGALLAREGVIRSRWAFIFHVSIRGVASDLKPGVYSFSGNTIPEITEALVSGGLSERLITIPEGWTIKDIAEYLENNGIGSRQDFLAGTNADGLAAFAEQFPFLKELPAGRGLEGYLFPDTYKVYHDASAKDVIVKMLANFERKIGEDLRAATAARRRTLFEIVTMAALIEKEVVALEERALVSGILWKRMDAGIPLQVDATIIYIKTQGSEGKAKNGRVSAADTKIDSLYNTYLYRGLPIGPIGNPGLSTIQAAIYPKLSPYLYYLSTPDGTTIFSRTLEEHNNAKAKYLKT